MNNLVILPLIIPLLTAILLIFIRKQIGLQKAISLLSSFATLLVTVLLIQQIAEEGIQALHLGGWVAPFGITLVADMFATLLVLTTAIVGLCCLLFAFHSIGEEHEQHYFYPFFHFLMAGVNGSFLTGDIFNLFVCFEVMLVASYVLITLGGKKIQLREGMKYLLVNIISSSLFVLAVAYLYGVTGTLNMAHLSVRVAEVGQGGLLTTVSLLFLIVFSIKSALFLYFWLPGAYGAPPTAVAALFGALLTKVGIYSIFRTFTLIFYHQPEITHAILIWMAALTMILGSLGAIAYWDIKRIISFNVIVAVGFIIFGLGVFTADALLGSVYYLIQDMIVKALLFILGGMTLYLAGSRKMSEISGLIRHYPVLGWFFFIAILAVAGIPPLSGFVGKLLITKGALASQYYLVAAIGLLTSLLVLYSLLKIFLNCFWGESTFSEQPEGKSWNVLVPCGLLVLLIFFLGLGGEWIYGYIELAVEALIDPNLYIEAVLD